MGPRSATILLAGLLLLTTATSFAGAAAYGADCTAKTECTDTNANTDCLGNKCYCATGYTWDTDTSVCEIFGANCADTVCKGENVACTTKPDKSKSCQCASGYKRNDTINTCDAKVAGDSCDPKETGSCGASLTCNVDKCKTPKTYDQSCDANSLCTTTDTTCSTTTNKCACTSGLKWDSGTSQCVAKVAGDSCDPKETGSCGASLTCDVDKCKTPKTYDQSCDANSLCTTTDTTCSTTSNKCACTSGLKWDTGTSKCVAKTENDECTTPEDNTCGSKMVCMSGPSNYCKAKTVGDKCEGSDGSQCSANMVCTNGECACANTFKNVGDNTCGTTCKSPYSEQNGVCVAPKVGDSCEADTPCVSSSMTCTSTKCACADGYKQDGGLNCVQKAIGDTCTDTSPCGSSMECGTDSKCACATGQSNNGEGYCAATCASGYKKENSACTAIQVNSDCEIGKEYTQCGKHQKCVSSKCVCMEGFTAQSGLCEVPNNAAGRQEVAALPLLAVSLTAWLALLA